MLVAHIFKILLAPVVSKLVNYSRHSETLNFRKNSKLTIFWQQFDHFQNFSKTHCTYVPRKIDQFGRKRCQTKHCPVIDPLMTICNRPTTFSVLCTGKTLYHKARSESRIVGRSCHAAGQEERTLVAKQWSAWAQKARARAFCVLIWPAAPENGEWPERSLQQLNGLGLNVKNARSLFRLRALPFSARASFGLRSRSMLLVLCQLSVTRSVDVVGQTQLVKN